MQIRAGFLALLLALAVGPAWAVDSVSFEVGQSSGDDADTNLARLGMQWDWDASWRLGDDWLVGGYWDASVAYWRTNDRREDHDLVDVGFTPMLRLQRSTQVYGALPYAEIGIGAHLLSDTDVSDDKQFSTGFQFGSRIGVGVRFGERGKYDLSYSFQHVSNADIEEPNPGIDFNQLRFLYRF